MLNKQREVIYVGKAKNLSARISSYFTGQKDLKTQQLISQIDEIEITVTNSETEALLLELQLIKQLQPKYNIIFKDAKSFPYIYITSNEEYPKLILYRGNKEKPGEYFGPYPNIAAAKTGVELLQTIFGLRQCNNKNFVNRNRPCLQYQLHRCTAPCVGKITKQEYLINVSHAKDFLQGKTTQVINNLWRQMEKAAAHLAYEKAAVFHEQIQALTKIQNKQIIISENNQLNIDVLGIAYITNYACIHKLTIRSGQILYSKPYFSNQINLINNQLKEEHDILSSFIMQHYLNNHINSQLPTEIVIAIKLANKAILETTLNNLYKKPIKITTYSKGKKAAWINMAQISAKEALASQTNKNLALAERLVELTTIIKATQPITRIECFDISHTQGSNSIGVCVVFTKNGPEKTAYRKYNINIAAKGDDYAALQETLTRHYNNLISLNKPLPELILIDGGKGQLAIAEQLIKNTFNLLGIQLIGVAKGKTRKIGAETLYLSSKGNKLMLNKTSKILNLIQQIRDEAHRFAISSHRAKRMQHMFNSSLTKISGIGAKRRAKLLTKFGGYKEIYQATAEELAKVPTINIMLAKRIYNELHNNNTK